MPVFGKNGEVSRYWKRVLGRCRADMGRWAAITDVEWMEVERI